MRKIYFYVEKIYTIIFYLSGYVLCVIGFLGSNWETFKKIGSIITLFLFFGTIAISQMIQLLKDIKRKSVVVYKRKLGSIFNFVMIPVFIFLSIYFYGDQDTITVIIFVILFVILLLLNISNLLFGEKKIKIY